MTTEKGKSKMTKIVAVAASGFLNVGFRIYQLFQYGENKGKPNPATFTEITLQRYAVKGQDYESVGDTFNRLKKMLDNPKYRIHILHAKEADWERDARRERDGLVVVSDTPIITQQPVAPVRAVDDESLGIVEDNGRIKSKRSSTKVKKAA